MSRFEEARADVARACRVLANEHLADGVLGHVSVRVDDQHMLVRCRGAQERGLAFTNAADIRLASVTGSLVEDVEYTLPNEWPIHGRLLQCRPEIGAVVHAHPRAVLVCGIGDLALRPVFGAYDIPAMRLAFDGVPTYPRSVLIRSPQLADEVIEAMRGRPVCVLRGHGLVATGASLAEAVAAAVRANVVAEVAVELARAGVSAPDVSPEDLPGLPDLGAAFNDDLYWRHLVARLPAESV